MKSADRHLDPGFPELFAECECPGILIALYAHEADQTAIAVSFETTDNLIDANPGIGLIIGMDEELHFVTENMPLRCIEGQPMENRQ